ncbi:hypothetical protein Pla144_36770 [Bythopirellula polymerisocia]|uniref:Uncharacterized protein n=1 Tax=Bythopirellula polymerisocia TaxID=2528003 RepID=A0A5C6CN63_9BACT|nr:hypothetical protein Pla144_36770 [Bythopirellula polymerisocia]
MGQQGYRVSNSNQDVALGFEPSEGVVLNLESPLIRLTHVRENDTSPIQAMYLRHQPVSKSTEISLIRGTTKNLP